MKSDSIPRPLQYLIEIALLSLVIFFFSFQDEMFGGFIPFTITPQKILIPVGMAVYGWVAMYCWRDRYNVENQYKWLRTVSLGFCWVGMIGFIFFIYGGFISVLFR